VLSGKEISHNNLVDLAAALEAVQDLPAEACAIVKHANPCGLAVADDQAEALAAAWEGDPVSAFGSVIAFSSPLRAETVGFFELAHSDRSRRKFVEVVAAPAFEEGALEALKVHPNLRAVRVDPAGLRPRLTFRSLPGACLLQEADVTLEAGSEVQTQAQPAADDPDLVRLGLVAVRQVKSNAISVVRRRPDGVLQLLGMGGGNPTASTPSAWRWPAAGTTWPASTGAPPRGWRLPAGGARSALLVSDAFFPFPDNVEAAAEAGIRTLYEPGAPCATPRSSSAPTNWEYVSCSPASGTSSTSEQPMQTLTTFSTPQLAHLHHGKVRESFRVDESTRLIAVTDRLSAFDRVLTTPSPARGQR